MAKDNWLKNNWLALCIIALILGVGIAWGITQNQQVTNTKEIEKKLDKEVFQMHSQQNTETLREIRTTFKEQRTEQRADMKEIKDLIKNGRQ